MYFSYYAYGHGDGIKSGVIKAESRDAAIVILVASNLQPISVELVKEGQDVYEKIFKLKSKVNHGKFPIQIPIQVTERRNVWRSILVGLCVVVLAFVCVILKMHLDLF